MWTDVRGLELSAAGEAAARHYDETIEAYLGFRRDTGERLKRTFAADPEMPMAHCLRGYFMQLFAHAPLHRRARESAAKAEAAAAGATARERAHVAALRAWVADDVAGATQIWEDILVEHPLDVLALKLAHYTHFYCGESGEMRNSVARVLPAWSEAVPGYGYVLGVKAFSLEEAGDYAAAEAAGRRAVELNPRDSWATHAVAHVMEMQGRTREGIAWLDGLSANWEGIHNFVNHLWWHLGLFHLEREDYDAVLKLFDERFGAPDSEEYLDICNATSMLWRLQARGVPVGARWQELAAKSESRIVDRLLAFADAHYMLAFAATGRWEAAERLREAAATASAAEGAHGWAMRECGAEILQAITAYARGDFTAVVEHLWPIRGRVRCLGGSHAQRDLFQQMLILAALKGGRLKLATALLAERAAGNPASAWSWKRTAEVREHLGDAAGAMAAREKAAALLAA